MKNITAIIFFFLFSNCLISQTSWNANNMPSTARERLYSDTIWLITGRRPLDRMFKKWKFDFVVDARQTIISNTQARLLGIRFGMEYRRVNRFGFGIYNLGSGVALKSLIEIDAEISEAVLNLKYTSIFYERVLFFNRKWEWSAAVHQGFGKISGWYRFNDDPTQITFPEKRVRPFEISTTGYYNLTWWCSVGAGVGYRFMRGTPEEVRPIFNSGVVIARVRIKFGKLARSIWNKQTKYEY